MRKDLNVSYLGIVGSAVQTYNFRKRKSVEGVSFYEPYECYSYNPYTAPMYNSRPHIRNLHIGGHFSPMTKGLRMTCIS